MGVRYRCPGSKEKVLLASLLLEANHPVPTDRLLEALWPEGPPATADGALRVHISHLRRALGDPSSDQPRIEAVRRGYKVNVAPGELDAATFQQLVVESQAALRRREPALAVSRLRAALGLWRGVPLWDIAPEAASWPEVDRLVELRLAALENRIEADLALGREAEVLGELRGPRSRQPAPGAAPRSPHARVVPDGPTDRCPGGLPAPEDVVGGGPRARSEPALQRLERAILRQETDLEAIVPEPTQPGGPLPAHSHARPSTGSMVDERKRVTVMVCDLAGSQSHPAIDPEGILAMLRPYHRVVREQINRVEGSTLRFLGSSITAVLGVPRAHEDDAARAVRAALRIRATGRELNEASGLPPLTVRIGVATGDALVLAGEADEGVGIVGDVVNRAAMLHDLAVPGTVAVGEATYRSTQDLFEFRPLEHGACRAGAGGMAAYPHHRTRRPIAPPAAVPHLHRARIGAADPRDGLHPVGGEPIAWLRVIILESQAWARAGSSGSSWRRCQERAERVAWRVGRCLPHAEAGDLWPVAEVVKDLARLLETDDPSVALAKLDRLVNREVTDAADRALDQGWRRAIARHQRVRWACGDEHARAGLRGIQAPVARRSGLGAPRRRVRGPTERRRADPAFRGVAAVADRRCATARCLHGSAGFPGANPKWPSATVTQGEHLARRPRGRGGDRPRARVAGPIHPGRGARAMGARRRWWEPPLRRGADSRPSKRGTC